MLSVVFLIDLVKSIKCCSSNLIFFVATGEYVVHATIFEHVRYLRAACIF